MIELTDLKFNTCAYFYKIKEGCLITDNEIKQMLIEVTSTKIRKYLFDICRVENNGVKYSLRIFKDKPKMPRFIAIEDNNWKEQKIGYYLFIEYSNHVAIFKKNCIIPKDISSKFESINYNKLINLYTDNNTEFKKINMQNLDGSDHAMRFKSYGALNLKENISPIGASRYYIRSLKGNNGNDHFALTLNTSKIHDFKDIYTLDEICKWVKATIDKLNDNNIVASDFLNIFAKPVKYEDIYNNLQPTSLLLFTDLIMLLIDKGAKFSYCDKNKIISNKVLCRGLSMVQRCFESVNREDKDGKIYYYTGHNNCIEIKLLKSGIKLINSKWDNISISETPDEEYDGTLLDLINKNSLFNLYFTDTELIYNNRVLFRDTKLLSSAYHFLDILEVRMNGEFLYEKHKESSPRDLENWHEHSIFKYVESTFMPEYRYFICDDCGIEWADHIGISENRITFFIEKHKTSLDSASDFQDVVGQALKNIANLMPSKNQLDEKRELWNMNYLTSNIPRFRSREGNVNDAINEWLKNNQRPNCQREICLVVDFIEKERFKNQLESLMNEQEIDHEAELRMRLWLLSSFVNTCLEYGVTPLIYCR